MILDFITQYWYLFAMLIVIVLLLSMDPAARSGARRITPLQLPTLQARESAILLDVCEPHEYRNGHIQESINIPFTGFKENLARLNKHKTKPIILICARGVRATKAATILRSAGSNSDSDFKKLYILEGGLAAWRKENLPLVKN